MARGSHVEHLASRLCVCLRVLARPSSEEDGNGRCQRRKRNETKECQASIGSCEQRGEYDAIFVSLVRICMDVLTTQSQKVACNFSYIFQIHFCGCCIAWPAIPGPFLSSRKSASSQRLSPLTMREIFCTLKCSSAPCSQHNSSIPEKLDAYLPQVLYGTCRAGGCCPKHMRAGILAPQRHHPQIRVGHKKGEHTTGGDPSFACGNWSPFCVSNNQVWLLWIVCTEDYQAYQGINHARVSRIGLAAMDRLYGGPGAQRWQNLDTTGQGSPVGQVRCAQEEACKFFLMG
eukprot:1153702-Pelagomonas_calceolata.AAC.7